MARLTAKEYQTVHDDFLEHRDDLHVKALQFLAEVTRRAPHRRREAERLVARISRDWRSVRPETGTGTCNPSPEVFDPANWSEVDARPLRSALVHCGDKFNVARSYYEELPADEKRLMGIGMRL